MAVDYKNVLEICIKVAVEETLTREPVCAVIQTAVADALTQGTEFDSSLLHSRTRRLQEPSKYVEI